MCAEGGTTDGGGTRVGNWGKVSITTRIGCPFAAAINSSKTASDSSTKFEAASRSTNVLGCTRKVNAL